MSTPRKPGERGDGGKPDQKAGAAKPDQKAGAANAANAAGTSRPDDQGARKPVDGPSAGRADSPAGETPGPQRPPVQTPPWQRGQQQQRSPQTDANRAVRPAGGATPPAGPAGPAKPGNNGAAKPAAPSPTSSRPVVTGTAAPRPPVDKSGKPGRPVVTGTAAPKPVVTGTAAPKPPAAAADTKIAAHSKTAGIDGPTRTIARTDLAKDMPDLSAVKHPSPAGAAASTSTGTSRKVGAAALTATAPAEGEGLRATVQVRRFDPWSMLKVSLVISIALFFVWMVAVGLLYVVLDGMGVWDRLNSAFTEIVTDSSSGGLVTSGQVFGYSALVGLMNVVLFTALATIGSFIYNLCSDLVGGVQVTLADPD